MTRPQLVDGDWQAIVGTPAEVRDAVAAARKTGRLTSMTYPRRVRGGGLVCVHIHMRQPELDRAPVRRWPLLAVGGAVLAASTAVAILAVAWVVAHWAMLLGAAVVAAVVVAVLDRIRG